MKNRNIIFAMLNQLANSQSTMTRMKSPLLFVACLILGVLGPPATELSRADEASHFGPFPFSGTFVQPANLIPGQCSFDVQVSFSGKTALYILPGNRLLFTDPQTRVTFTNLSDPTKSVSLILTGTVHIDQNGNVRATGHNLFIGLATGFVYTIGDFTLAFDSNGNPTFTGTGQIINICTLIN
jgi:hypothetical protein